MTQYGWHMLRADSERERASLADDESVGRLHDELAELHVLAASDLSDAWQRFSVPPGDQSVEESWDAWRALFATLYGPVNAEKLFKLLPPALQDAEAPVT